MTVEEEANWSPLARFFRKLRVRNVPVNTNAVLPNVAACNAVTEKLLDCDVADIMWRRNETPFLLSSATKSDIASFLSGMCKKQKYCLRSIPICEGNLDSICGHIEISHLVDFCVSDNQTMDFSAYLKRVICVAPSMRVIDLLIRMNSTKQSLAVVIDEYGGVEGVVFIDNVIDLIVGNTPDDLSPAKGDQYEVSGRVDIQELEHMLGISLKIDGMPDDIETLGGMIMFMLGRLPITGEEVEHASGLTFKILSASAKSVDLVAILNPNRPMA